MPSGRDVEVPSTVQRSPAKARATYRATLESAEDQYDGDEARAHRAAFAALTHTFEKVGDHWEPKEHPGPSDAQAAQSGGSARDHPRPTAEGVDANASKAHLMDLAKRLGIPGRSRMAKGELVAALEGENRRATAQARRR